MQDLIKIILSELSQYLENLVGLLSGPKSFVRRRRGDREQSLVRSFTFLGVSFVLYSLLLVSLLPPGKDFLQYTAPHAIFILVGSLLTVGVLHISWRMVGGNASFDKHLIIFLYYSGVGLLITGACLLLTLGVVRAFYPELYEPLKNFVGEGKKDIFEKIEAMFKAGDVAGPAILTGLPLLPMAASWIWTYIGWGAYRELNLASKRASAIAFIVVFLVFFIIITPLLTFIAYAIRSP